MCVGIGHHPVIENPVVVKPESASTDGASDSGDTQNEGGGEDDSEEPSPQVQRAAHVNNVFLFPLN